MLLPCYIWCWTPLRRAQRSQCLESESPSSTFEIWSEWSEWSQWSEAFNNSRKLNHFRAKQLVNPAGKLFPEMLHDICSFCAMSKESTSSQFVSLSSVRFFWHTRHTPSCSRCSRENCTAPPRKETMPEFLETADNSYISKVLKVSYHIPLTMLQDWYVMHGANRHIFKSSQHWAVSRLPPSGWIFVALLAGQWNPGWTG